MSTERIRGISSVGRGEDVTTGEEVNKGGGAGKSELLGEGVCLGSQSSARSVGKKRWEVHSGVATLDGRVLEDEEQEVKVAVVVNEGELMMFDE